MTIILTKLNNKTSSLPLFHLAILTSILGLSVFRSGWENADWFSIRAESILKSEVIHNTIPCNIKVSHFLPTEDMILKNL